MGFFVGAFLSAYVEHEGRLILPNVRGKGAAPPPPLRGFRCCRCCFRCFCCCCWWPGGVGLAGATAVVLLLVLLLGAMDVALSSRRGGAPRPRRTFTSTFALSVV